MGFTGRSPADWYEPFLAGRLCAAITFAASGDPYHPVLRGIHFSSGLAEATDGFRIARTRLISWSLDVLIPAAVVPLVASANADVEARCDGRVISFASGDIVCTCSTLAYPYPELSGFFEEPSVETLVCGRDDLAAAVEAAASIPGAVIDIRGFGDCLQVSAESSEIGHVETSIETAAPLGLDATFTASYLRDALRLVTSENIRLELCRSWAVIRCDQFSQLILRRVDDNSPSS